MRELFIGLKEESFKHIADAINSGFDPVHRILDVRR
jgi:hypothetical protein